MSIKKKLLIVDDEANVLKSIKRLLIDMDITTQTAHSGVEALELLKNNKFQVVVSDYRMPGLTGVEFLSKVKEMSPDTVRIILSGFADAAAIVDAINTGQIYKFVPKPWNDQELMSTIRSAFEKYELQSENTKLYAELSQKNKELEGLNKALEQKVKDRTRDLEMKNRALNVTYNILNSLVVGVLGIDSEGLIVYSNSSMEILDFQSNIIPGMFVNQLSNEMIVDAINDSLYNGRVSGLTINTEKKIGMLCTPLSSGNGAIAIFGYFDPELWQKNINSKMAMELDSHGQQYY